MRGERGEMGSREKESEQREMIEGIYKKWGVERRREKEKKGDNRNGEGDIESREEKRDMKSREEEREREEGR